MSSSSSSKKLAARRPSPLRTTKSFGQIDANGSNDVPRPKRASTLQNGSTTSMSQQTTERDAFEGRISEEISEPPRASVDLEDLPIELISLADSFIDSLSAKVHPTPPNIDNLSQMFQDFYATAAQHIQTHVSSSVATRQKRESSPAPSSSSTRASAASLLRAKAASLGSREKPKPAPGPSRRDSDQQMLTAEEFADRKRARKLLEQKKGLYEEAVERRLCEGIYDKIYRHRTTQDEAQDDKLRSKTAALAVVGIGPADLGVDLGGSGTPEALAERQEEVKNWLEGARKELVLMHESRYPLGKLNHLKAAHKCIIDTLSHFHPSSSADELMPMLIYTLITMPPDDLNVISDVNFIQRFRWAPKLMGEAAYCLTSLEAGISFLDTVDLSTLRADEAPSGPVKASSSRPSTPKLETFPPAYSSAGAPDVTVTPSADATSSQGPAPKPLASPTSIRAAVQLRNRRFSDLVNTPAQAIGAASDAVDQSLKTIGTSLGESYKFLLGKLREHPEGLPSAGGEVIVPKTLDDARKLIGTPPPPNDDEGSVSGMSEDTERRHVSNPLEDKVLSLISGRAGRKVTRDHSADSARSGSSSRRVSAGTARVNADEQGRDRGKAGDSSSAAPTPAPSANPALIDSVRNLGNSLNPMARLSGIGGFRGFGRIGVSTPSPTPAAAAASKDAAGKGAAEGGDLATAFPELAAALPPKEFPKINPPIKRFVEMQSPADLKLSEVVDLLRDYRRLAKALKDMDAFKE